MLATKEGSSSTVLYTVDKVDTTLLGKDGTIDIQLLTILRTIMHEMIHGY